jgi:hypothetical protein
MLGWFLSQVLSRTSEENWIEKPNKKIQIISYLKFSETSFHTFVHLFVFKNIEFLGQTCGYSNANKKGGKEAPPPQTQIVFKTLNCWVNVLQTALLLKVVRSRVIWINHFKGKIWIIRKFFISLKCIILLNSGFSSQTWGLRLDLDYNWAAHTKKDEGNPTPGYSAEKG